MNGFLTQLSVVLTSIVGIAMVAVIVSKNSATADVLSSFWNGFSGALTAATGPVSNGAGSSSNAFNAVQGVFSSFDGLKNSLFSGGSGSIDSTFNGAYSGIGGDPFAGIS